MVDFLEKVGANPGRSGHRRSIEAARVVFAAREALAALFNAPDPLRVVFGLNVTEGINLALHGLLRPGDHVVTSSMEHNAVMRPLRALEKTGVRLSVVSCSPDGRLDPAQVGEAICFETKLVAITHASNVTGALFPITEIGQITRSRDVLFLVDAAQTGGAYPLDMQLAGIDLLAFTGHKSLYGPMGTGGLILGARVDPARLAPLKQGGTGSRSEFEDQPEFLPDRYESGTPNAVGLAGLEAALRWLADVGVDAICEYEETLTRQLLAGLAEIPGVCIYGPCDARLQTATVSFNIEGILPSEVGLRLDDEFGVLCRVGLHCAPAAHRTMGTFPIGAVRFGLGAFNTVSEVERALSAVRKIATERAV